jgi:hypothetical protein
MAFSLDVDQFMEIKCVLAIVESKLDFDFFWKTKESIYWLRTSQSVDRFRNGLSVKSVECIHYSY